MRSTFITTSAILLVSAATLVVGWTLTLDTAEAEPVFWNGPDGWAYRRALNVTNSATAALTDHQVVFQLSTSGLVSGGKMRADCGDIRVATDAGVMLGHWIENGCNGSQTRVWAKVPSVPAGTTRTYYLYYGNPAATSTSSTNATFIADSIRYEVSSCVLNVTNTCIIANHSAADTARDRSADRCTGTRSLIDWGYPCTGTGANTSTQSAFSVEYRYLFVPDVSGTWSFEVHADNWSELATSATDDVLVTSHVLIAPNYADNPGAHAENRTLSAGQGAWYSFVAADSTGAELQRIRLARPAGPLQVLSAANFPTMIFRRTYSALEPSVAVGGEEGLPGPVISLTSASGPAAGEITLDWELPATDGGAAVTKYRIHYATSAGGPWAQLGNVTTTGNVITGASPGFPYHFRVQAQTARGMGVNATVIGQAYGLPSVPQSLAVAPQNRSVTLTWTAPASNGGESIDGYRIYAETTPVSGGINLLATTTNGANTSFVVQHLGGARLANGTTYAFAVRAYNLAGDGTLTTIATATPAARPDPPRALTTFASDGTVQLSWEQGLANGAALTSQRISRATGGSGYSLLATTGGANLSFLDQQVVNGVEYRYRLDATNAMGTSELSNEALAFPAAVPSAPLGFAGEPGNHSIRLTWSAPVSNGGESIDGYRILIPTDSAVWNTFATTGPTNTSFVAHGLENGTDREFRIAAYNAMGEGEMSPSVIVAPGDRPDPPADLRAVRGNERVDLTWSAGHTSGGPQTTYSIWRGAGSGSQALLARVDGTNTSFEDFEVLNGVVYQYNLTATNAVGTSASSNFVSAKPAREPDAPDLGPLGPSNGTLTLSWTAPAIDGGEPVTGYRIFEGEPGSEFMSAIADVSVKTVTLSSTNGVERAFRVAAMNAVGVGTRSNIQQDAAGAVPYPPANVSVSPGNHSARVSWSPPIDDGGRPILHYVLRCSACPVVQWTASASSDEITGLANGTTYAVTVGAVNAMGEGNAIGLVSFTPRSLPDPPASLVATRGNGSVTLSWAHGHDGGATLTGHEVWQGTSAGATSHLATIGGSNTSFVVADLVNGQPYFFHVTAANTAGTSARSHEASATPATTPDPPAAPTATPLDRAILLTWSAGLTGGSPLTGHSIEVNDSSGAFVPLATTANGANTSFQANGLVNGVAYTLRVRAANALGESAPSATASATPRGLPFAPAGLIATRSNQSVHLSWSAADGNGAPVTGHEVRRDGVLVTTISTPTTSLADTGLTNGVTYTYVVRGVNVAGAGASAEATATPASIPDPPVLTSATRGDGTVQLAWSAGHAQGSAITVYRLHRAAGEDESALVASPSGLAFEDTGLTNGVTYRYHLTAENALGTSAASNALSAKPATVPSAPALGSVAFGNRSLTLFWTPSADGGEPRLGYDIEATRGGQTALASTNDGANTSFVLHGLENGASYSVRVRARNVVGAGAHSGALSETPAGAPYPPLDLQAARGDRNVTLTWTNGADDGRPIGSTRILRGTSPGNLVQVANLSGSTQSYLQTGLTNGNTYYFAVRHASEAGVGNLSETRAAKPATSPGAPQGVGTAFGDGNVTLSWSAPSVDGGEPVTGYRIERGSSPADLTPIAEIGANTSFVASGLTNGVPYSFRVRALNVVGTGTPSAIVNQTPAGPAAAPRDLLADAGRQQVALDWNAPSSDGGRPITGYAIRRAAGAGALALIDTIGTNTSYLSGGLVDGTTYRFTVAALTAYGEGHASAAVNATPVSPPGTPRAVTATTTQPQITIAWQAPSTDGGALITQYRIYASSTPSGAPWLVTTVPASNLSYVDAAPGGTTRHYTLRALNAAGESASSTAATGAAAPDPLQPPPTPDTYRSCTRDSSTHTAACTRGSSLDATGLAAGGQHTCALLADGRVDCYGNDASGQSGDHLAGAEAVAVSAGASHTCILLADGNVDCYGSNAYGKAASYLGGDAVAVAAGGSHTCFVRAGGAAQCQGSAAYGQSASRTSGVIGVATGTYHTCFLLSAGTVECQGYNDRGQAAGDAWGGVVQLSAGRSHTCALTSSSTVRCWGALDEPIPDSVQGAALAIASGRDHACALLTGGAVLCWGEDRDGQNADLGSGAVAIAAGDSHSCAARADGTIVCWGAEGLSDHGQATNYPLAEGASGAEPSNLALVAKAQFLSIDIEEARSARRQES